MRKKYYLKKNRKAFFAEMISKYGDCCMICKEHVRHIVIDHDHKTGYMRGILCVKHNAGLGMFNDNPALLRLAAAYLEEHVTLVHDTAVVNLLREATTALLLDDSYTSDRARARQLAHDFSISVAAAQTRVSRARKMGGPS